MCDDCVSLRNYTYRCQKILTDEYRFTPLIMRHTTWDVPYSVGMEPEEAVELFVKKLGDECFEHVKSRMLGG